MTIAGNIKKAARDKRGVSLIELTIAIGMFSVIIVIIFDAFLGILRFNRETVQKQSIQDHTEFLFSLMTKEIRMAKINHEGTVGCSAFFKNLTPDFPFNGTYLAVDKNNDGKFEELRFQNYEGLCVRYFVEEDATLNIDRLKVVRFDPDPITNPLGRTSEAWVLPLDIKVVDINFEAKNIFEERIKDINAPVQPPLVRFFIKLSSNVFNPSEIQLFEEISGRNIEQF